MDAQIEQQRMRRELEADATRLAVAIAAHLLARFPAQACHGASLLAPQTWLASLPQHDLQGLAKSGETLEVLTPLALDPAAQAVCAQMLQPRLDQGVTLQFRTAPELIAGLELRGAHGRLRNNWRADLDRMVEALNRDDQPLAMA
jgi:F-type H+-transporting ATPase subunit b